MHWYFIIPCLGENLSMIPGESCSSETLAFWAGSRYIVFLYLHKALTLMSTTLRLNLRASSNFGPVFSSWINAVLLLLFPDSCKMVEAIFLEDLIGTKQSSASSSSPVIKVFGVPAKWVLWFPSEHVCFVVSLFSIQLVVYLKCTFGYRRHKDNMRGVAAINVIIHLAELLTNIIRQRVKRNGFHFRVWWDLEIVVTAGQLFWVHVHRNDLQHRS